MEIKQHRIFGIFYIEKKGKKVLLTENLIPNKSSFDEEFINYNGKEFRVFDPKRSKLASTIIKGSPNVGFREGNVVLYLGSSHGYTTSFVSDIIGNEGFIFAVDIAPRVMRDLIFLCYKRKNIAPILADANKISLLKERVSAVDVLYQDIAQKNQVEIFLKNVDLFLKSDGYALLALKARSIDVTKQPKQIFKEVKETLENHRHRESKILGLSETESRQFSGHRKSLGFSHELEKVLTLIDYRELEPFQKDHCMFICKKR